MAEAKRDANMVVTLLGVSSVDGITPVTIYVDPTTHRVLVSAATASPGGLDTEVQFNDGGTLAGNASFTYNKTTHVGTIGSLVITAPVSTTGHAVSVDGTQTLTNKRINPRVSTTASSATPTPNADTDDQYQITALAAGATFAAPSGTPVNGQKLTIRILDNGTARSLTWNAIYRQIGIVLPTTTTISKTMYIMCIYNTADTKWDAVAYVEEA